MGARKQNQCNTADVVNAEQSTVGPGYNDMKGTEYFVSL
jgi:hypothetical protein